MKKFLVLLCAICMCFVVCLSGCGLTKDVEIQGTGGGTSGGTSGGSSEGSLSGLTETSYTVQLDFGDEIAPSLSGLQVQWINSSSVYTASFSTSGFAYSNEPDGEYTVSLLGTLNGFSYNPNIYSASNTADGRNVTIEMYKIKSFSKGTGLSLDDGIRYTIEEVGLYRLTFSELGQIRYVQFSMDTKYRYSLETFASVSDNNICPNIDEYYLSTHNYYQSLTGGSDYNGSYTKNIYIDELVVDGRSASFAYGISISSMSSDYSSPKYLDIFIKNEGDAGDTSYYKSVALESYNTDYDKDTYVNGSTNYYSLSNLLEERSGYKDFNDFTIRYCENGTISAGNSPDGIEHTGLEQGYWYVWYSSEDDSQGSWKLIFMENYFCHYGALNQATNTGAWIDLYNLGWDGTTTAGSAIFGGSPMDFKTVLSAYEESSINIEWSRVKTDGHESTLSELNNLSLHPVSSQLKTYLYLYAMSYALFNDGSGTLETLTSLRNKESEAGVSGPDINYNYNSDDAHVFLFDCGIFI